MNMPPHLRRWTARALLALTVAGCATAQAEVGSVSYYGHEFAGRRTASGETFNPEAYTMAHRSLPFGTRVRITDPASQRSVVVKVNDRGPVSRHRIADLSQAAARELGIIRRGTARILMEVLSSRD
jgi:rare lipoprotein A